MLVGMTTEPSSASNSRQFPLTQLVLRVFFLLGTVGGIAVAAAVVLGLRGSIPPGVAIAVFAVGGLLTFLLAQYWRGRRRLNQVRRAWAADPKTGARLVSDFRRVDPRWLAVGAALGLCLAASTLGFAAILLNR